MNNQNLKGTLLDRPKLTQGNSLEDPSKKENQNDNNIKSNPKSATDKIPFTEVLRYTIYCICFIIIVNNQANISEAYMSNESFINQFINEVNVDDELSQINSTKIYFPVISKVQDVIDFINLNIIDSIYDQGKGFYVESSTNFQYFVILTPLRIIQKRALLTNDPRNILPYRWAEDQSGDNVTNYGPNKTFAYKPSDNGFPIKISVCEVTPDEARATFTEAINNCFIDNITKFVAVDMGIYNSIQDSVTYFEVTFSISKSGIVADSEFRLYTRNLLLYYSSDQVFRGILEGLFLALFMYYFVSEFIKIYNNIKNAILLESVNNPNLTRTEQLAEVAGKSFKTLTTILKAILNHINNFWTFLDVASLIFSLIIIITWLDSVNNDVINDLISNIPYENGKLSSNITTQQRDDYNSFNQALQNQANTFSTYFKLCALNELIMMLKLLRYTTKYITPMRDMLSILTAAIDKLLVFSIILTTVLFAFALWLHFYYGHMFYDFSNLTMAFIYLVGTTNLNFSQIDTMLNYDIPMSFAFNLLFMFMVNFILCNMLLIYTIDEYRKYMEKKKIYKAEAKKESVQDQETHAILKVFFFLKRRLFMRILKYIWKTKFESYEDEVAKRQKMKERELYLYENFNFDMNIKDTLSEKETINLIYNNEANIIRDRAKENLKLVVLVWKTLGMIIIAACYIYISLNQEGIPESNSTIQTVLLVVMDTETSNNTKEATVNLNGIENSELLQLWLNSTFAGIAVPNQYKLQDETVYTGLFIASYNYLITNEARITVRYNSYYNNTPEYAKLSRQGLTPCFAADASNPYGEYKGPIIDNVTGITYNYSEGSGYKSKGGYIWKFNASEWTSDINEMFNDGVWGDNLNTMVIEIPLYQIMNNKYVVLTIIFTLNDANAISSVVDVYTVDVNIYDETSERFRGFLEVCFVVFIVLEICHLTKNTKKKYEIYQAWYSLYIDFFPKAMKELREEKKPEIIRKLEFLFDLEEIMDILIVIILSLALMVWLLYILLATSFKVQAGSNLSKSIGINTDQLLSYLESAESLINLSEIANSIACIMLCMKVLYYYSFNRSFYVISQTIKQSFALLPFTSALLLLFLLGYAIFLYWIEGPIYPEYSSISYSFIRMMEGLASYQDFDMDLVKHDGSRFLGFTYFLPYVFIIDYVISNIFLGVCYDYYTILKKKMLSTSNERPAMGLKEFFRLSYTLIRKGKKKKERIQRVEINDQFLEKFDPRKVFDGFHDTMVQHGNFHDEKPWVTMCTKNLIYEYETRKVIKRMCKEVALSYINEMGDGESFHIEDDIDRKFKEFTLRQKYWNYYRIGLYHLLKFITTFDKKIKEIEEFMNNTIDLEEKMYEKNRMKIYVLKLQEAIENNLQDLNKIRMLLNDYDKFKKEDPE